METTDKKFAGSMPKVYESVLVPLIFAPYAADIVQRLMGRRVTRLLEIAAGTGAVTRAMAEALPRDVSIVATDLNQPMLDVAAAAGTSRSVEWRQADAMNLPFDDASFDAVVCQFGVMFFPDKAKAFAETRRVLRDGGVYLFNVWDRIEDNEFADTVTRSLESLFPNDPPQFFVRTPHGYHDRATIERDVAAGGFTSRVDVATVTATSRAASARDAALALVQGTPLRNEIETRDPTKLERATDLAAEAIAQKYGRGAVEGKLQAHVFVVER